MQPRQGAPACAASRRDDHAARMHVPRMGAEYPVALCDLGIFVDQAAEPAYLSPIHRDKLETGCAVAALPTDIVRSSQRAWAAYTAQVRRYLDLFAALTPADDPDDPYLILAALVGAIALARAVNDPSLSDETLERVARALNRHVQGEYAPSAQA